MKRCLSILLVGAMLFTGCAAMPLSSPAAGSALSEAAKAEAITSAASTTAATAAPLADWTDEGRESADPFSLTTSDGAFVQEGSVYTLTKAGTYTLAGALAEGQIVIDAGDDDEVKLLLQNVSLSSALGAPILVRTAAEVTLKAEADTYSVIRDLRTGAADQGAEDDGALWAACDLKLTGSGTLIVSSTFDNGVKSKDDLSVKGLTLQVTAPGNALKGNDSVTIKSGKLLLVSTAADGVKTENSDVSGKGNQRGNVSIQGGQVDIYAAQDGISAACSVEIGEAEAACTVNIYTAAYADASGAGTGASRAYLIVPASLYSDQLTYWVYFYGDPEEGVWASCAYETMVYSGRTPYYGLAFSVPAGYTNMRLSLFEAGAAPEGADPLASTAGETVNTAMNGYLVTAVSDDAITGDWVRLTDGSGSSGKTAYSSKGIKAASEIRLTGGAVAVYAGDDGLHANGGEPLDSGDQGLGNITVSGGSLTVTAADDGLHADNALTVTDGVLTVAEAHEGLEGNVVTIAGGTVSVAASDDGINACAGSATPLVNITGGYVKVTTPAGDTDAIDSNGSFAMSGGTVLLRSGSSLGGMSGSLDVDGSVTVTGGTIVALGGICQVPSGNSVNYYVSQGALLAAGDYRLTDGDGQLILAFSLPESCSSCWIASEAFALGGSYALLREGTVTLSWTQSTAAAGDAISTFGGGFGGWGGRGGRP